MLFIHIIGRQGSCQVIATKCIQPIKALRQYYGTTQLQYYRIRQQTLNNNHNKILVVYMFHNFHLYYYQAEKFTETYGKTYEAYTSPQTKLLGNIRRYDMCQQTLINNNKILLLYMIDTFYLYHQQAEKLSEYCGKTYEGRGKTYYETHTSSQVKLSSNMQRHEIRQRVLINNDDEILLLYMMDTSHLYYQQAGKLSKYCGKTYKAFRYLSDNKYAISRDTANAPAGSNQ